MFQEANTFNETPINSRKYTGYCIDLRKVNEVTVKDMYPLPKIGECFDALAGCEYFSCLDMANGYYQIKMEGEDRDKTAFVTKYGQFVSEWLIECTRDIL